MCGQDSYGDYLSLSQLYRHVMISEPTWATVLAECGDFSRESQKCQDAIDQASNEATDNFNVYDLYSGVWGICAASALTKAKRPIRPGSVMDKILRKQAEIQAAAGIPANQCTDDDDLTNYMNLPAVQKALNVKSTQWQECGGVNYNGDMPDERKVIYPTLVESGVRVLIYNGDAGACRGAALGGGRRVARGGAFVGGDGERPPPRRPHFGPFLTPKHPQTPNLTPQTPVSRSLITCGGRPA